MKNSPEKAPHSAEQFGPQRDFWWNPDFLELMAKRWQLEDCSTLVDVGCGLGHWSRLIYPFLKAPAQIIGIDREPEWVRKSYSEFHRIFHGVPDSAFTAKLGDATNLPLPDNAVEGVTCQTVLMHLPDPKAALKEMIRVAKPGGIVFCTEPNNFWNYLTMSSETRDQSIEQQVSKVEFWLRYHRGLELSGQGNHAIGDLLPGYFAELGLEDIQVYLSDRAAAIYPPYNQPYQAALLENDQEFKKSQQGPWDREKLWKYFKTASGSEESFNAAFESLGLEFLKQQSAIQECRFHAGNGSLNYLVSGRKQGRAAG